MLKLYWRNLNWLYLSILLIIIDQCTKFIIKRWLSLGNSHYLTSFFNIVHVRNYGAAFSFLNQPDGQQRWLFSSLSLLASILLMIWLLSINRAYKWQKAALACIIGGALGNFYGRLSVGYVIDFVDFHLGSYHWPAFNIADSAVCIGATILIITLLTDKK